MQTTCFTCKNLLSDFVEGILPSVRHEELKKHLESCQSCSEIHGDLVTALECLNRFPKNPFPGELRLRVNAAVATSHGPLFTKRGVSRLFLYSLVPIFIVIAISLTFPSLIPWKQWVQPTGEAGEFVRYYPLLQGAGEVVEEQSQMIHVREPFTGSMWEEGGLSPDDFERTFQSPPNLGEKNSSKRRRSE